MSKQLPAVKLSILQYSLILSKVTYLGPIIGAGAVKWNYSESRWVPISFKKPRVLITFILVTSYVALALVQFSFVIIKDGTLAHIPSTYLMTFITTAWALGVGVFKHGGENAAFLNSLLLVERKYQEEYRAKKQVHVKSKDVKGKKGVGVPGKDVEIVIGSTHQSMFLPSTMVQLIKESGRKEYGRIILFIAHHSEFLLPTLTLMFILFAPCAIPMFLRSTLKDCPATGLFQLRLLAVPDLLLQAATIAADVFIIMYTFSQGAFAIAASFCNGAIGLNDLLLRIRKSAQAQEEDGAGQGLVVASSSQLNQLLQSYKSLKLLETMYNNMNMSDIVPIMVLDMFILSTLSLYTCVALHDTISVPMLAFIAICGLETACMAQGVMYNIAGNLNFESSNLLQRLNHGKAFRQDKYLWRLLKSCAPLKVRIGTSGNYMEKVTPLNITQMTVDQATSLILVTK